MRNIFFLIYKMPASNILLIFSKFKCIFLFRKYFSKVSEKFLVFFGKIIAQIHVYFFLRCKQEFPFFLPIFLDSPRKVRRVDTIKLGKNRNIWNCDAQEMFHVAWTIYSVLSHQNIIFFSRKQRFVKNTS